MVRAFLFSRNGLVLGSLLGLLIAVPGCPPAGGECAADADCADDGLFCNGTESCDTAVSTCVSSGDPCNAAAGEVCDETTDACLVTTLATPSRSTTIILTSDDRRAIVVNRETDSVSVIEIRDAGGADVANKLAEVTVGDEPRFVSIHPNDREAYVTNAADGTVSVIALTGADAFTVVDTITVGTEPRGCAITPNGLRLYVANQTEGTVTAIDVASRAVLGTVNVGGQPAALAITNDGDTDDTDERVFVTQFYAELISGADEVSDVGKQGVVQSFSVGTPGSPVRLTLSPIENVGFTADRTLFCTALNALAANNTFCPDVNETDPTSATILMDPQGAYPNQLASALIRGNNLFLPNVGASPEPPIRFNVNLQALVHVANTATNLEEANLHVNLNDQVKAETQPEDDAISGSLVRVFGADLTAIDADADGENFLIVSRGGNFVFRAGLDADGRLTIGAPDVIRLQTGNLPSGVVMSADGARAYVNNEVGISVTALNLTANTVITRDIPSGTPPAPGTSDHEILVGKLAFFTSLGIPDDGILATPIRDFVPVNDRNKASDNGWSSCGSCHPDGLADGVTWSFGTGPRQTVSLDAFFNKNDPTDQRISNYSAVMGSVTDFNNNSRGVQGGVGFAGNPPNPLIFGHGITEGASDALDAMTSWVKIVRVPNLPRPTDATALSRGGTLFDTNCASCHGGAKWTKSEVIYDNNPTFTADVAAGGTIIDARVTNAGPQIVSFEENGQVLRFLENVGTFDAANEFELRGAGATTGQASLGGLGFNVPSLLSIAVQAPYFHDGSAQTLEDVFDRHALDASTIADELSSTERSDLLVFLRAIDSTTVPFASETDAFQ